VKSIVSNLKNKYFLTLFIFFVYTLFLDDFDVFVIISQKNKLNNLKEQRDEMHKQLIISKDIYKKLNHINYLESYARSKKFFKKDNEEIFVISYK
jgi:cell division protein FtsB